MSRWWEHPRFDICDTFKWRLAFTLLAISPFVEVLICAFSGHKGWMWVGLIQIYAWIAVIFAVLARELHMKQQVQKAQWEAYEAELRRRYGLDEA